MTCCNCVEKLALRLVEHHKIDLIYAFELADKGMERHEKNQPHSLTTEEKNKLTIDPDYTQNCAGTTAPECGLTPLGRCGPCSCIEYPSCACPAPLAHSHQVTNNCTFGSCSCYAGRPPCLVDVESCICGGTCSYACDTGYVWNGSACVVGAVAPPPFGDGLIYVG